MTKTVAVAIPNEAYIPPESFYTLMLMSSRLGRIEERWKSENRNPQYRFHWFSTGRIITPFAREQFALECVEKKMDYLIMIDNDMIVPHDLVEALLYDMEKHKEIDILAPLAFMRNPPHLAVIYELKDDYDPYVHKPYYWSKMVKSYPRDSLVECDAVGFGAVIIRGELLRKLNPPYFFTSDGRGEDVFFCHKAKSEQNARIFMDTRIKLGHIKNPDIIDEDYVDKWNKDTKQKIIEKPHKYLALDTSE